MKNIHEVQKQSAPCPSKQVRFSAFVDKIVFEALEISADESTSGQERGGKSQLWYQRYEYQRFKLASLQLCRGARQEHGNCFEQTFCQGPMSPSNMVFKDLARKFPYLRGLEQWVSLRYGRERENQRRKTIYSVLKTQQNFRLASRTGTPPGNDFFYRRGSLRSPSLTQKERKLWLCCWETLMNMLLLNLMRRWPLIRTMG
jgi:hypothetical protein